jgi:multidrug resistance efflux pump
MEEKNYVELRSEDVQEILGTPPGWLVLWGTAVVFLGFGLMIAAAWFVRYPDVVRAEAVITTDVPPVELVARASGRVAALLVADEDEVPAGKALAVLQSTARYRDVFLLDSCVGAWQQLKIEGFRSLRYPDSLDVGELEPAYAEFVRHLEDFKFGRDSRSASVQSNIGSIQLQISQLEQSIAFEQKGLKRVGEQLKIAEELYEKQKKLYEEGITARAEFEKERTKLADIERQRDQYEDNILQRRREIISLKNSINNAALGQQESSTSASTRLLGSLSTLRSGLNQWKQTYLLVAPIAGKVSLNGLTPQLFVKEGEQVLAVVPPESDKVVGRLTLPVAGSGKVAEKQTVIIKLDNYPYQEFGTIKGITGRKSLVPKDNRYSVPVGLILSEGKLRTSHGKLITFEQQLQGSAEIVTDDKGFLQRIAEQVFGNFQ